MKLDPGIHIVMHSVLSLKSGVTFTWRLQKKPPISNIKIGVYRAIDEIYPSTYVKTAGQ